jgi:hypothetical protein
MSPITELFPSDTELFLLTVGHNVIQLTFLPHFPYLFTIQLTFLPYFSYHIRYGKYGSKVSWIVKWYGKYGWKVSWIVKIYGKYGSKVSWIVKIYGKYGSKVSWNSYVPYCSVKPPHKELFPLL